MRNILGAAILQGSRLSCSQWIGYLSPDVALGGDGAAPAGLKLLWKGQVWDSASLFFTRQTFIVPALKVLGTIVGLPPIRH